MPADPRFALGRLLATPAALEALAASGQTATDFFARHQSGDWGDVSPGDARLNDAATADEADPDRRGRVLSAYTTRLCVRLWVITEHDRSATTVLLPDEY